MRKAFVYWLVLDVGSDVAFYGYAAWSYFAG